MPLCLVDVIYTQPFGHYIHNPYVPLCRCHDSRVLSDVFLCDQMSLLCSIVLHGWKSIFACAHAPPTITRSGWRLQSTNSWDGDALLCNAMCHSTAARRTSQNSIALGPIGNLWEKRMETCVYPATVDFAAFAACKNVSSHISNAIHLIFMITWSLSNGEAFTFVHRSAPSSVDMSECARALIKSFMAYALFIAKIFAVA